MSNTKKVSVLEKVGYGLGDFSCNLFWQPILMFLLFFYTDVFGISAASAAILFLVARVWDAINDPIMGAVIDRTHTRWGKFRPYMLFGAIPFGILAILTFTVPDLGGTAKLIYAYVTYIGLGMIYTIVNTPYSALSSSITQEPVERSNLSVIRMLFAMASTAIVIIGMPILIDIFGQDNPAQGYQYTMIVFAILAVILMLFSFMTTRERYSSPATTEKFKFSEIKTLYKNNRPLLIISLFFFLTMSRGAIGQAAGLYHLQYVLNRMDLFTVFGMIALSVTFVSVLFVPLLSKKWDKKTLVMVGLVISFIRPIAYFSTSVPLIIAGNVLGAIGNGIITGLLWGLVPDIVEYNEYKAGERKEGIIFSMIGFSLKMGTAIGGVLPGIILDLTGYHANVAQTPLALFGIKSLMSLIPLIIGVLTYFVIRRYELTGKRYNEILEDLKKRRSVEAKQIA
ncbi:MFS transporter [Vallitalea okinawensis]|uniref:MFS transporter n=1 Tax=Vallitalea okinawensis TaxID=2078660 RepID=UPI000CFD86DD|nr:MFS transporter [Vallitalea okinawensis]